MFNQVFNPTPWDIKGKVGGKRYRIKKFSDQVVYDGQQVNFIYDIWHVDHLLKSCKASGLVSLEFGKDARAKYKTFESYKKHQIVAGLKQALVKWERALADEEQALAQMKAQGGSVTDRRLTNIDELKFKVEQLERLLSQVGEKLKVEEEKLTFVDLPDDILEGIDNNEDKVKEVVMPDGKELLSNEEKVNIKFTANGRVMVDGKFASKEVAEKYKKEISEAKEALNE